MDRQVNNERGLNNRLQEPRSASIQFKSTLQGKLLPASQEAIQQTLTWDCFFNGLQSLLLAVELSTFASDLGISRYGFALGLWFLLLAAYAFKVKMTMGRFGTPAAEKISILATYSRIRAFNSIFLWVLCLAFLMIAMVCIKLVASSYSAEKSIDFTDLSTITILAVFALVSLPSVCQAIYTMKTMSRFALRQHLETK